MEKSLNLVKLNIPWERLICWSSNRRDITNIFISQGRSVKFDI